MVTIWMVNETYISETGRITEKLHKRSFLHREKASKYMSTKIDELCDIYNRYSHCRNEGKNYRVISINLYSAAIRTDTSEIERLILETVPVELDES